MFIRLICSIICLASLVMYSESHATSIHCPAHVTCANGGCKFYGGTPGNSTWKPAYYAPFVVADFKFQQATAAGTKLEYAACYYQSEEGYLLTVEPMIVLKPDTETKPNSWSIINSAYYSCNSESSLSCPFNVAP